MQGSPQWVRLRKTDMYLKSKSILAAAVGALFLSASQGFAGDVALKGAELGKWTMDYDAAVKLAGEKNLPLLLDFTGSDWCHWCKLMDKTVFAKPAWEQYAAKNIVTVTVDFPQDKKTVPQPVADRNEKLKDQFNVEGFPTYVILEKDGKSELGRLGAGEDKTPESFIQELGDILRFRPASVEAKVAELGPDRGKEYRAAIAANQEAKKALEDWKGSQPKRSAENDAKYKELVEKIRKSQIEPKAVELGAEKGKQYRAAFDELLKAERELETWGATVPEQNAENDKKYQAFLEKIKAAQEKVDAF